MLFNRPCPSCNYIINQSIPIDTFDSDNQHNLNRLDIRLCPNCCEVLFSPETAVNPMEQCDQGNLINIITSNSGDHNPIILAHTDQRVSVQPLIDSSLYNAVDFVNMDEDLSDTMERYFTASQPNDETFQQFHNPVESSSIIGIAGTSTIDEENGQSCSQFSAVDMPDPSVMDLVKAKNEAAKFKKRARGKMEITKDLFEWENSLSRQEAMTTEKNRMMRIDEQEKFYQEIIPKIVQNSNDQRLILDIDRQTNEVRVEVASEFAKELKPHQRDGIKFMYNSIIENVDKIQDPGSGCILAHEMGSGKSRQVIALIHTLLTNRHTKDHIRRVLIITTVYYLQNWADEFDKWIVETGLNEFNISVVNYKSIGRPILLDWRAKGGVIIISNTLFNERSMNSGGKQDQDPIKMVYKFFSDPGPNLIIVDEAHLLGGFSKRMRQVIDQMQTKRRILLTGSPLHNKLDDYYYMIELIKPKLLGNMTGFKRKFCDLDISHKFLLSGDKSSMVQQVHEFQSLVSGTTHLFNQLHLYLHPKYEFFISIRPSQRIIKMYSFYMNNLTQKYLNLFTNPYRGGDHLSLFLCLNHPSLLQSKKIAKESTHSSWYEQFIDPNDWMNNKLSGKFVVMFKILESCVSVGDKLVVISQSKETLHLIGRVVEHKLRWKLNVDYFLIDRSRVVQRKLDKLFNIYESSKLLLCSLRNFGVDLTAANRIILFDVFWNPIEEEEVISRIYRLGQTKPVYVYRFVTEGTIEETIYRKQIGRRKMIDLILDDKCEVPISTSSNFDLFELLNDKSSYLWHLGISDPLLADALSSDDFVLNCVEPPSCWKKLQ